MLSLQALSFVGLGGACGAIARYVISIIFANNGTHFPYATFIANISGAFLIGFLYIALIDKPVFQLAVSESLRQLLIIGFLGALTTYSSFSLESIHLMNHGLYQTTAIYILSTLVCCLLLAFIGTLAGKAVL